MREYEIRISANVNTVFLANMLEKLRELGCEINEDAGVLKLKYDNNLESKVTELINKIV